MTTPRTTGHPENTLSKPELKNTIFWEVMILDRYLTVAVLLPPTTHHNPKRARPQGGGGRVISR